MHGVVAQLKRQPGKCYMCEAQFLRQHIYVYQTFPMLGESTLFIVCFKCAKRESGSKYSKQAFIDNVERKNKLWLGINSEKDISIKTSKQPMKINNRTGKALLTLKAELYP